MPKYAVILQTTKRTIEFRPSFGFYNKHINDLERAGYEIIKIDLTDAASLKKQLQEFPESSIGFLWLRMHGAPQSMTASENFKIDLVNINEIFADLPFILHDHSTVFLHSCSTGSLKNGCNNMQFAFAKLTLEKPNIQIVAPSEDLHVPYFSILDDGNFAFEMIACSRSTTNISVILGQQTKVILSHAKASNVSLDDMKNELKDSLQINKGCPFLENFTAKFGTDFNLTDQLIRAISTNALKRFEKRDMEITLNRVKDLIEVYHANPNYPDGFIVPLSWETATPLANAIYYKHTEMALYLLEHGADPYYTIKSKTLIDYAKQCDENSDDERDFELMFINEQRREQNDNSKMSVTIKGFLDLKNGKSNNNNEITPLALKENYEPIFTSNPEAAIPKKENVGDDERQQKSYSYALV
jgi:hypothetical protein